MIQLERRGYFMVDKLETANNKMTLNFIPDGKQSNMSKITSKLDQKEVSGGKTANSQADKEKKKAEKPVGEDGEVKLSKKELNKLKKKEGKAAAKSGEAGPKDAAKGKPAAPQKVAAAAAPSSISAEHVKRLDACEAVLAKSQFMSGNSPSNVDRETFEEFKVLAFQISPASHPHFFSWFSLVMKFNEAVRNSW